MPEPPPELKKLDYFAGTWISEGEIRPGPMGPGGKLTMTERNEWMDGGFFLMIRSEFTSPAGSGSGMAFMGYDAGRKVYTYDEFNSTGEAQHSVGSLDGDTWTWSGEQHIGGKTRKTRFLMKMVTATTYSFRLETSVDGKEWAAVMQGRARKEI